MSKTSVVTKIMSFSIMIALLIASFPTASAVAKTDNNQGLESKWSQLTDAYAKQMIRHESVHKSVDHWLSQNKDLSKSDKAEIMRHLTICNAAIASAGTLVKAHSGFDTKGSVVDRGQARKSIRELSYYLRQHVGSINNLNAHLNKK